MKEKAYSQRHACALVGMDPKVNPYRRSTLIAAHKAGRCGYLCELELHYDSLIEIEDECCGDANRREEGVCTAIVAG